MKICISGIGIISALGTGVREHRRALREERDGIRTISRLQTSLRLPAGEIPFTNRELEALLLSRFPDLPEHPLLSGLRYNAGVPAGTVGAPLSRTALLGMLAAREALEDAGLHRTTAHFRNRFRPAGIISATSVGGMDLTEHFYRNYISGISRGRIREAAQHDCYSSTARIAACCGPDVNFSATVSTACSSAANAIMLGARMIRSGLLDCAVVGGTDALSLFTLNGFNSLKILSSGKCRPFDRNRDGLNLGEGAGYLVLQREESLLREPYAILSGYANANDAYHQTASSAEGDGACRAMSEALKRAETDPAEVDYINAHGTGTVNNDASETKAIRRIWGRNVPRTGSTKSYTGHTLAAAGGIEAVFSVTALFDNACYPTLRFSEPPEETEALIPQLKYEAGVPLRHVLSNSFGFGGNDTALLFSRYKR